MLRTADRPEAGPYILPRRGVLQSAANLLISMLAGGKHTAIHIARPPVIEPTWEQVYTVRLVVRLLPAFLFSRLRRQLLPGRSLGRCEPGGRL